MSLADRWIGIDGSASADADLDALARCHAAVRAMTRGILQAGGGVVVSAGADPRIGDGPETAQVFYWTVLDAVRDFVEASVPAGRRPERPFAQVVLSSKKRGQIVPPRQALFDGLCDRGAIELRSVKANWNTGAILRERQAVYGDGIVLIGGGEGVEHLATLYLETGRPVVPLDVGIGGSTDDGNGGARKLHDEALNRPGMYTPLREDELPRRLHRASLQRRDADPEGVARVVVDWLDDVVQPAALLLHARNSATPGEREVRGFIDEVVRPFVEQAGYRVEELPSAMGAEPIIDRAALTDIHRSAVVVADLTAGSPAVLLGLGYALARRIPTLVTGMTGTLAPIDATAQVVCTWKDGRWAEARERFAEAWSRTLSSEPLVPPAIY